MASPLPKYETPNLAAAACMAPSVVVIFGPVAAGKSTLARAVAAMLPGAALLHEPTHHLESLGLIADLAAGRPGTALAIQITVLMARLKDMLAATHAIVVCDGHLSLDGQLYIPEHVRAGRMNITDVCVHAHALAVAEHLLPQPWRQPILYVYLRTSASECMRRCRIRARRGERGLDEAFFARMLANCDAVVDGLPAGMVLRIDDDKDIAATATLITTALATRIAAV